MNYNDEDFGYEYAKEIVVYTKDGLNNFVIKATKEGIIRGGDYYNGESLQNVFGKELAEKIMSSEGKTTIENDGLRIGGEGMKGFYDQILPRFMDKYGKKWGVKTGEVELPNLGDRNDRENRGDRGLTMWSVDVTDDMRESVMRGQPLFRPKTQSREGGEEAAQSDWYDRGSVERIGAFAGYTPKQIAAMNARQEESARQQFREAAEKLHLGDRITFVDTIDEIEGIGEEQRKAWRRKKGWYSPRTGKIVIILGNHRSMDDVMKSIMHEGVAHYGLRQLFGKHFDTFLDNVYMNASPEIRGRINEMAKRHGWDFREATEEYLATLAEDTDFENPTTQSWWRQVKAWFFDMLHKIGFKLHDAYDTLTDNELRYLLWRSYENLVTPGRYNSFVEEAKDVAKQYELKVGEWDETWSVAAEAEPNATMVYNGKRIPIWATNGRRREDRGDRTDRMDRGDRSDREDRSEWSLAAAEAKQHWPDAVVLVRDGDFYVASGEDARKAAKVLGLPLVQKTDRDTVGFPANAVNTYLTKLVRAGSRVAVVDSVNEEAVVYGGEDIEAVNARFNEELERFTPETSTKMIFDLGKPSSILLSAGVENRPIRLYGSKVAAKMSKHGFKAEELRDLPRAIAEPIAVFENLERAGNRSILTELRTEQGNFLVTIDLGKGTDADFDIVSSVFGKNGKGVVNWIVNGKLRYVDKEKALNYLRISAPIAEASDNSELNSAAKIVKNFENPQIPRESFSENSDTEWEENDGMDSGIRFRDGDFSERDEVTARDYYERMVSGSRYQFREAVQDSMLGLRKAYEAILGGGKKFRIEEVPGNENAYLAENRMSSVNAAEQHNYFVECMKPLLEEIHKICGSKKALRQELTDYMMAKHGLERNEKFAQRDFDAYQQQNPTGGKTLGDFRERDYAGLTALTGMADVHDAELAAMQMVADFEARHDVSKLWAKTKKATGVTLAKIYLSGMLSEESYEQIRDQFEFYIPLQGFDETTSDEVYGYLTSRKGPFGSPIKHAEGRSSKADDPIATSPQRKAAGQADSVVRFRGEEEPVFYSNAMRAVESIKQERATPEQWLKMIEKQGGMKAGEDKWLGLSEWLKGMSDRKDSEDRNDRVLTLTKQEVLDYIRANEIRVEEVEYGEGNNKYETIADELRGSWNELYDEAYSIVKE